MRRGASIPQVPLASLLAALRTGQAFTIPAAHAAAVLGLHHRLAAARGAVFDLEVDGSVVVRRPRRKPSGAERPVRRRRRVDQTPPAAEVVQAEPVARRRRRRRVDEPAAPAAEVVQMSPIDAPPAVVVVEPEVFTDADPVVEKAKTWGTQWSAPGRLKAPPVDPAVKKLSGGA